MITLCECCKVIIVDATTPGCREIIREQGETVLEYDGPEINIEYNRTDTFPDFPALTASATAGCGFCSLLKESINRKYVDDFEEWSYNTDGSNEITVDGLTYLCSTHPSFRNDILYSDFTGLHTLRAFLVLSSRQGEELAGERLYVSFDLMAKPGNHAASYFGIPFRTICIPRLSRANIKMMRGWIDECDHSHPNCKAEETFLPTRLIYVGRQSKRRRYPDPHLIITTQKNLPLPAQNQHYRYAALSYCWGSLPTSRHALKTENKTVEKHCSGIRLKTMPQGFQDMVKVTRALQIDYIWIDCLCIIQDDDIDWQKESSAMQRIYRNAVLTVVAASSTSPHEGFLRRGIQPQLSLDILYTAKDTPMTKGTFHLTFGEGGQDQFYADVRESAWNQCGWTFQEDFLARRVLYFSTRLTYIQCQTSLRVEGSECVYYCQSERYSNLIKYQDPYVSWYSLIGQYNDRDLTYSKDKLPAIAGLAQVLAERTEDQYLAGLWSRDLIRGLLWISEPECGGRPDKYRAPSWSWAWHDNYVQWNSYWNKNASGRCEILDARTSVDTHNPFGCVSSGLLVLLGKYRPATVITSGGNHKHPFSIVLGGRKVANACFDVLDLESSPKSAEITGLSALLVASAPPCFAKGGPEVCPTGLLLDSTGVYSGHTRFRRVRRFEIWSDGDLSFFDDCKPQVVHIV